MHELKQLLISRVAEGLQRKAITSCSKWAMRYRIMGRPFPGPLSFRYHPWTKEIHDCEAELVVGQKSAQAGFTDTAMNRMFYSIDIFGISCLYILPTEGNAQKFSASRFDPAIELSPHLISLFTNTKNVEHKRAGSANLFIRGSRSKNQLKSDPVGLLVFDEVDEMYQENIPLAFERMSGQTKKQAIMISTPTIDNFGVNVYYQQSTQDHFYFSCPLCHKLTELVFPDCLVITAENVYDLTINDTYLKCKECNGKLDHNDKPNWLQSGRWVSSYSDRAVRGFAINQLYSSTVSPADIAKSFIAGQSNPSDEQEFYNSKLGITHTVQGAKINDSDIINCTSNHKKYFEFPEGSNNNLITMGIDVGKWLHFEICQWTRTHNTYLGEIDPNAVMSAKLLTEGKVQDFEELEKIFTRYRVLFAVIDANPERRKALEFAQKFSGRVRMCFYGNSINNKVIHLHSEEEHTMTVDRTSWLDISLGRIRNNRIALPIDLSKEYKDHVKALTRIYQKDAMGNPVGRYQCGNEDDHFAHARNYCEIALPLAVNLGSARDITGIY